MEPESDLLNVDEFANKVYRRRDLLPWWIKAFTWIFLVFGAFIPVCLIFGIAGYNFEISLYGFETFDPLSIIGLSLIILFLFKAIVGYGLWTEKKWAIDSGIIDAITGITICVFMMFVYPFINPIPGFKIRMELLVLIPYILKLKKIKTDWNSAGIYI